MRVLLILAALLASGACGNKNDLTGADQVTLSIRLVNGDVLPTHLFGAGETFPCCQVAAGGNRTLTESLRRGTTRSYQAGRNGEILASVSCRVDLASTGETVSVTWNGTALACSATW